MNRKYVKHVYALIALAITSYIFNFAEYEPSVLKIILNKPKHTAV